MHFRTKTQFWRIGFRYRSKLAAVLSPDPLSLFDKAGRVFEGSFMLLSAIAGFFPSSLPLSPDLFVTTVLRAAFKLELVFQTEISFNLESSLSFWVRDLVAWRYPVCLVSCVARARRFFTFFFLFFFSFYLSVAPLICHSPFSFYVHMYITHTVLLFSHKLAAMLFFLPAVTTILYDIFFQYFVKL